MVSFGLDAEARNKVADVLKDTLGTFSINYAKHYKVALCKHIMEESFNAQESKDEWQLSQAPDPSPPAKSGYMKKQSSILKSWKNKYFTVNDKYELSFSSGPDKKEEGVINLWGYKSQLVNDKPKGKRKGGPEWVEDEERSNCKSCDKPFTVTSRRHHCRACGEIFCGPCTSNKIPLFHFGYDQNERVCNACFEKAEVGRARADTFAPVQPEDKEDQTFFGISLLHKSRNPITLQCESKEDRDQWNDVINICISNAQLPINPDPVLAEAFEGAYQDTCWHVGYYRWWRITGSEEEMLSELVTFNITRRVLNDALNNDKIPAKFRKNVEEAMRKQVNLLVNAAVGPAWNAVLEGIAKTKAPTEEKLKPILEPVAKAKEQVINKITQAVLENVNPIVDKVAKPIMDQLVKRILEPLVESHTSLYHVVAKAINELRDDIKSSNNKEEAFKKDMKRYYERLRGDWGDYRPIWRHLDALWDNLIETRRSAGGFLDSINASSTVHTFNRSLHSLGRNALYTLESDAQLQDELKGNADAHSAIGNAFKRMAPKLLADSRKDMTSSFVQVLVDAILPPLSKAVLENDFVSGAVAPIDDTIPDSVKDFISASGALEDLINNLVTKLVESVVDSGNAQATAQLEDELSKAVHQVA